MSSGPIVGSSGPIVVSSPPSGVAFPVTETEADLLRRATLISFEVVSVEEDALAPAGSVRLRLRADPEDLEDGAVALLLALTGLSFGEARPAGMSDIDYAGDQDRWTAADLLAHLHYRRGGLHVYLDYVRGRMLKTTIDIDAKGNIELLVVNRGSTALRWVDLLRGHRHLAEVALDSTPVFFGSDDQPLRTLADWQALHPAEHWREGRSAMLLAQRWSGAEGFPEAVLDRFAHSPRFSDLRMRRAIVEHPCAVPGLGKASYTDIMVFAEDDDRNPIVIAVEGKVDEGFGPLVSEWLTQGKGERAALNRLDRVREMAHALGLDPEAPGFGELRYQLVHRAYAAWRTARDEGCLTAILLVHSFMNKRDRRSGNWDLTQFTRAFGKGSGITPAGLPWQGPRLDGVDLWFVWVEEK